MFVTQCFHGGAVWHKFRPAGSEGSAHCFREPCGFPCFVFPSSGVLATWCLLMEAVGERGRRRAAPWLMCPGHTGVSGSQRQVFRHAHWSFCVASSSGLCTYGCLGQTQPPTRHMALDPCLLWGTVRRNRFLQTGQGAVSHGGRPEDRCHMLRASAPHHTPQELPVALSFPVNIVLSFLEGLLCEFLCEYVYLCECVCGCVCV